MSRESFFNSRFGLGLLLILFLIVMFPASLPAQTAGTGALRGSVTDSTGAVVPNTTVVATSLDTGQARSARTSQDGAYTITLLPPGSYHVKFEAMGFQTTEIPSVTVTVTETSVLDRRLEVGSQTQEITVTGEVETIQTASSALGTVADSHTVTELPLNTRNYTNLLAMSAGANGPVTNASSIGKGSTYIAVNGGGTGQNTYLQDGVPINNWFSFNTGVEGVVFGSFPIPNPDAISEFKIQTSSYDAGYGRNPGSNVNVITKTGTNNFHGAAFEFFRNTVLNANDWFVKRSELTKGLSNTSPVLNANVYGGTFGGPIKKDKLFFFVSYQESDQKNGLSGYGSSSTNLPPVPATDRGTCAAGFSNPVASCDATAQTFIGALARNLSPLGTCPNAGKSGFSVSTVGSINVACPIGPVGAITGAPSLYNINPVAISILQLKLPNGNYLIPSPGGTSYAPTTFTDPAIFKDHNGLLNLDYTLNNNNTFSFRYEYEADPITGPFPVLNANLPGAFLPGSAVTTDKSNQSAVVRLTSIITPSLVNEAHMAYQRYVVKNAVLTPFTNSQVGVKDLSPGVDTLSYFNIANIFGFGGQYQFPGYWPDNQFQWADQISWNHGKHTFRAGFEVIRVQVLQDDAGNSIGSPTFQSFPDFLIGRCAANSAGCTLSNGAASSNIQTVGTFAAQNASYPFYYRALGLNGFVQDDLRLTAKLTLNLGVRWEYDGWPTVNGGVLTDIWPSLVGTVPLPPTQAAGGTLAGFVVPANYSGTIPTGIYRNNNNSAVPNGAPRDNFAPRLGFAWQPTGDNKWALRGGFGMFYDVLPGNIITGNAIGITSPAIVPPTIGGLTSASLSNPWQLPTLLVPGPTGTIGFTPRFLNPGVAGTGAGALSSNLGQPTLAPNITTPVTYEWNLNTQYEFLPSWVVEIGYVGSHGIHQATQSAAAAQGQATTIPFNLAQIAGTGAPCAACALTGVTTNSIANVADRVPNLGFSANDLEFATQASYKYNSLQATVRKQLTHGLQIQAAYTWSRAFITQPFGINSYPYLVEAYGLNPNYRPQRLVVNYVWNLPLGHHEGFLGKMTDGWTLAGVTIRQDGSPLNITNGNAGSIFCGGSCTAFTPSAQFVAGMGPSNALAGGSLTQRVTNGLLNNAAQPTGTSGYFNSGVFSVAAPTSASVGIPTTGAATAYGNAGLGIVLGPGQNNWDASLSKTTPVFREGQTLQFRAEVFNAWNHPQFSNPVVTSNLPTFGSITTASVSPRIIQLALKFSF
jgi:Carboxypeptidase regulatory-like domain/TonB-dependent Receptor Plug Domain